MKTDNYASQRPVERLVGASRLGADMEAAIYVGGQIYKDRCRAIESPIERTRPASPC